jgi:hypothetical protein
MEIPHENIINTLIKLKIIWLILGLLGIALFFLITEYRGILLRVLPYLFVLLCPVIHIFMHRHHGGMNDSNN